jgi:hypothetical protein
MLPPDALRGAKLRCPMRISSMSGAFSWPGSSGSLRSMRAWMAKSSSPAGSTMHLLRLPDARRDQALRGVARAARQRRDDDLLVLGEVGRDLGGQALGGPRLAVAQGRAGFVEIAAGEGAEQAVQLGPDAGGKGARIGGRVARLLGFEATGSAPANEPWARAFLPTLRAGSSPRCAPRRPGWPPALRRPRCGNARAPTCSRRGRPRTGSAAARLQNAASPCRGRSRGSCRSAPGFRAPRTLGAMFSSPTHGCLSEKALKVS